MKAIIHTTIGIIFVVGVWAFMIGASLAILGLIIYSSIAFGWAYGIVWIALGGIAALLALYQYTAK